MGIWDGIKKVGGKVADWFSNNSDKLGAAGGQLASIAGTIGGNLLSYEENKALAEQQRAWMEKMSNTAHQREVKDLIAAGLNPVLSANSGAAFGSGASGSVSTSDFGSTINSSRALQMQRELQESTIQKQKADARLSDNLATKADYESTLVQDQAALNRYTLNYKIPMEIEKLRQDIANSKAITEAQVNFLANQGMYYRNSSRSIEYGLPEKKLGSEFWSSPYGQALFYIDRTTNSGKALGDSIMSFIPKLGKIDNSKKYYDYSGDRSYIYDK